MCNRELVCGVLSWLSDKVMIMLTTSWLYGFDFGFTLKYLESNNTY